MEPFPKLIEGKRHLPFLVEMLIYVIGLAAVCQAAVSVYFGDNPSKWWLLAIQGGICYCLMNFFVNTLRDEGPQHRQSVAIVMMVLVLLIGLLAINLYAVLS